MKFPRLPPQYRETINNVQHVLKHADNALTALWHARGGSPLEQALAGASLVGSVLQLLQPDEFANETLTKLGYEIVDTGVGDFLCGRLQRSPDLISDSMSIGEGTYITFWGTADAPRTLAAIYVDNELDEGPFALNGDDGPLLKLIQDGAWHKHRDLVLSPKTSRYDRRPHSIPSDYQLQATDAVQIYVGDPTSEWYVERMSRFKGHSRTIRLKGPSGVGKSTLARLMGKGLVGPEARTLKITSSALGKMPIEDVVDLAHYLGPDVLVLDDFIPSGSRYGDGASSLAFLEALHGQVALTVITEMTDGMTDSRHYGGGRNYAPGMRPGRIDATFELGFPNKRARTALFHHFAVAAGGIEAIGIGPALFEDILTRTEGLTGAYIGELVTRLQLLGVNEYVDEIERVFDDAPSLPKPMVRKRKKADKTRVVPVGARRSLTGLRRAPLEALAVSLGVSTEGNMDDICGRLHAYWDAQEKTASHAKAAKVLAKNKGSATNPAVTSSLDARG